MQMHKQSTQFNPSQYQYIYKKKPTTNIKKVAHKKGHKALTHAKRVAGQLLCYPSIPFLTKTCMIYFKNLGGISHNF